MKGFDVLHLKSAVKDRNRFPELSRSHETSLDFGQIVPLFNEELIPSDEFPVKGHFFARVAPLVKPTFGRILFKTVSMFVPYHQIAEDADAFLDGKKSWMGATPVLRYFTANDLALLFVTTSYGLVTTTGASATNYHVMYLNSSGNPVYLLFTNKGRYYCKIFNALGYQIPENIDLQSGSYWDTTGYLVKFSAYPLLAFFKGYNDWMSQSQRYNTSALSNILLNIRQNKAFTGYSTTGKLDDTVIYTLFDNLKLNYDNDYFTSAWQNPNAPLSAAENVDTPVFPSTYSTFTSATGAVSSQMPVTGGVATIYQRSLDFLRSFDEWVRRNNYAGSRDVQQIYARFGIKVDDYRTHFAHVLGTTEDVMNVGDVTSTAQTTGAVLGDYAGKAIVDSKMSFDYKSSDHGLLMVLGYVTVKPQMSFGCDRKVLRTEPLDWYNPEFDGIGGDPISYREVFESCKINPAVDLSNGDMVYGFTERYNAYRFGRDQITGDFKVFKDMDVWHCGRDLSALRTNATMIAQSSAMNTLAQTDSEYNRIFSLTNGDVDHFYFVCQFEVNALRSMLSHSQVPNLGTGDTEVPRNGNVIN